MSNLGEHCKIFWNVIGYRWLSYLLCLERLRLRYWYHWAHGFSTSAMVVHLDYRRTLKMSTQTKNTLNHQTNKQKNMQDLDFDHLRFWFYWFRLRPRQEYFKIIELFVYFVLILGIKYKFSTNILCPIWSGLLQEWMGLPGVSCQLYKQAPAVNTGTGITLWVTQGHTMWQ